MKKEGPFGVYKLPVGENPVSDTGYTFKKMANPRRFFLLFFFLEEIRFNVSVTLGEKDKVYKDIIDEDFINYSSFESFYKDGILDSKYGYLITTIDRAEKLA